MDGSQPEIMAIMSWPSESIDEWSIIDIVSLLIRLIVIISVIDRYGLNILESASPFSRQKLVSGSTNWQVRKRLRPISN